MSIFKHLSEEGKVLYEEACHECATIEAWVNKHFGSIPLPDGHSVTMDGEAAAAPAEQPKGGDDVGQTENSGGEDKAPGSSSPEAGGPAGTEDTGEKVEPSSEGTGAAGAGSEVREEHQQG